VEHTRTTAAADPEAFIRRWSNLEGGAERANYALFLAELCDVLGVPRPDPASATSTGNDYVLERAVRREDGSTGRIDLYRRDCFILEAKQSRWKNAPKAIPGQEDLFSEAAEAAAAQRQSVSRTWDVLMQNARTQAHAYARDLPDDHDWPPFILVVDVGRVIECYADFTGQGRHYKPYPAADRHRIRLTDLRDSAVRARLAAIWTDPKSLDPADARAKATRAIATRLAAVTRRLEKKHAPEEVALFLMRCLFTMFAENVGLLPTRAFQDLLLECRDNPAGFLPLVTELWAKMNTGAPFVNAIRAPVKRFNGKLFADARAFELAKEDVGELLAAAQVDWTDVEPAIFGALLEQALSTAERARLGAHYTPRPYVERLVTATLMDPLRADWSARQDAANRAAAEGRPADALKEISTFHAQLRATRVLDPACGTGNFLYVALELMKELETEVLDAHVALGGAEGLGGFTERVGPRQFLGIELNPRAAAITELVLWIGYLQASLRRRYAVSEPILDVYGNIQRRDAVLEHDAPVVRGGRERLPNPRRPAWPEAEFIVGNPPFIGGKDIRAQLGDAYVEALWAAHPAMNDSADLVMYWWDHAADILTRRGSALRRFGLVTTNSITQVFQRRTIERWLSAKSPLSLVFAVPDHPWTKATRDAAAVRIAMTVAEAGARSGTLMEVRRESGLESDQPVLETSSTAGDISADLTVGIDVTRAQALLANSGLCSRGVSLHGDGFIVSPDEAVHLGLGSRPGLEDHVRAYLNGRDLTGRSRGKRVIDLFGLTSAQVRDRFPEVYQHISRNVRYALDANGQPRTDNTGRRIGREYNNRATYKNAWWVFGEPRSELRPALADVTRYVATVETAKHRTFAFIDRTVLPDNMLVVVATDDAAHLAIMSSRVHVSWMLGQGGTLEDRPRYTKSRCFDPFPFPVLTPAAHAALADAGERLDAFRKARLAEQPQLTLTRLYNALEARRAGRAPTAQEAADDTAGSVLILQELHDEVDRLALAAYALPEAATEADILARLVALNAMRAAEEARGLVRWLRPAYQAARFGRTVVAGPQTAGDLITAAPAAAARPAFPTDRYGQRLAVETALTFAAAPLTAEEIAARYRGRRVAEQVDATLRAMAQRATAVTPDGRRYALNLRRAA
jgi:hypothetical protein